MNSSAGAPLSICFAKVELAAYEMVAALPLWRRQAAAIASSAVLRLAAAKTSTGRVCAWASPAAAPAASAARLRSKALRYTDRTLYVVIPAKAGIHGKDGSRPAPG